MKRSGMKSETLPMYPHGGNGGNGGWSRRSAMADGLDKPLKTSKMNKDVVSGNFKKPAPKN